MIAVLLVGVAAIYYGEVFPMATKSQVMVANEQQAVVLMQHKIDQLRAIGYGRLTLTEMRDAGIVDSSMSGSNYTFTTVDNTSAIYRGATGTIAITDFSNVIKRVTVTISWSGSARRQGNGSFSVTALIPKT